VLTCGYDEAAGVATLAEYASKDCIASRCAMKNVICPKLFSKSNPGAFSCGSHRKLEWYSMRWKIATFHKILKSGWKAEGSRLRTAELLARLLAVFCIPSWRIFGLTMMNRAVPEASPILVFMALEVHLLDQLLTSNGTRHPRKGSLSTYHSTRSPGRLLGSRR
jgi:hypothetical protein